ncbi:MAG: ispA [Herminiimonas sp.]|nr:ispA [Herminiimonas sp.]MDB5855257.1 ispA [Herminiimonas sp.]
MTGLGGAHAAFREWMPAMQALTEEALDRFLPPSSAVPAALHTAMRYAAMDGGKRVRPLLVFAAGALFDADRDSLMRAAAAVEMIHAYSLVHDDLPCMDNDSVRRGKPTLHVKYDEATAMLVGDALQAQAFGILAEGESDPLCRLELVQLLARASGSTGMCGGQAIDLASVGLTLSLTELEQMHRLKTGALLTASVLLGARCGKALSGAERAGLQAYAAAIGLAFQVVDDVLDATADSATLGKTAGKDAVANKPTYVTILGLEESRRLAQQLRSDAEKAIAPFGDKAQRLRDIAELIVQRKA